MGGTEVVFMPPGAPRMTPGSIECSICGRPLPLDGAVAFVDKQRIIHLDCYRPISPSTVRAKRLRRWSASGGGGAAGQPRRQRRP
jgi:hypothetical protein